MDKLFHELMKSCGSNSSILKDGTKSIRLHMKWVESYDGLIQITPWSQQL